MDIKKKRATHSSQKALPDKKNHFYFPFFLLRDYEVVHPPRPCYDVRKTEIMTNQHKRRGDNAYRNGSLGNKRIRVNG